MFKVIPAEPHELERLQELLRTATDEEREMVAWMIRCLRPVAQMKTGRRR